MIIEAQYSQVSSTIINHRINGRGTLQRAPTIGVIKFISPKKSINIQFFHEDVGALRHLGWEDSDAISFSKDVDVNGIEWERFHAEDQANEINDIWPQANYSPVFP